MLDILSQIADQFDQSASPDDMEKHASFLQERRDMLAEAPFDDFAVVLYDGRSYARKFPVQTAEDVRMSKEALDKTADRIPQEVVKIARYFIEIAGRQIFGESLYGDSLDLEGAPLTNVLYAGHVDHAAFDEQLSKTASVERPETLLPGHDTHEIPVPHAAAVLQAERGLSKRAFRLSDSERVSACRALVKRANDLGVALSSPDVTRYGRDVLPFGFTHAVRTRRDMASAKLASYFDRLAAEAETMGVEKSAECLRALDQLAGFNGEVGRGMTKVGTLVPSVDDVVFPVAETVRADADLSKVAALFGEDFADAYRDNPTAAKETLSEAERTLLSSVDN